MIGIPTVAKLKSQFTKTIDSLNEIEVIQDQKAAELEEKLKHAINERDEAAAFRNSLEKIVGVKS